MVLIKIPKRNEIPFLTRQIAKETADEVWEIIKPYSEAMEICGSYRRGKEQLKDVDLVVCGDASQIIEKMQEFFDLIILKKKNRRISGFKDIRFIEIIICDKKSFIPTIHFFTGSAKNNRFLEKIALEKNMFLNPRGLWQKKEEHVFKYIAISSEQELYKKLDIPYLSPEKR